MSDHEPLPDDAGEHAEGLRRLLARFPANRQPALWIAAGWYGIVVELDGQLAAIDPGYEAHQIKEKFGGLRFYAETSTGLGEDQRGAFHELIRAAEDRCATICELCGQPARLHKNRHGGVRTLCADCAAQQPGKFKPW